MLSLIALLVQSVTPVSYVYTCMHLPLNCLSISKCFSLHHIWALNVRCCLPGGTSLDSKCTQSNATDGETFPCNGTSNIVITKKHTGTITEIHLNARVLFAPVIRQHGTTGSFQRSSVRVRSVISLPALITVLLASGLDTQN